MVTWMVIEICRAKSKNSTHRKSVMVLLGVDGCQSVVWTKPASFPSQPSPLQSECLIFETNAGWSITLSTYVIVYIHSFYTVGYYVSDPSYDLFVSLYDMCITWGWAGDGASEFWVGCWLCSCRWGTAGMDPAPPPAPSCAPGPWWVRAAFSRYKDTQRTLHVGHLSSQKELLIPM